MIKVQYFRTALYFVFILISATRTFFLPLRHKGGEDSLPERSSYLYETVANIFFL